MATGMPAMMFGPELQWWTAFGGVADYLHRLTWQSVRSCRFVLGDSTVQPCVCAHVFLVSPVEHPLCSWPDHMIL